MTTMLCSRFRSRVRSQARGLRPLSVTISHAAGIKFQSQSCSQNRFPSIDSTVPNFAFAFDIDGVLLRGHEPLPKAGQVLGLLHQQNIPYILLTNGGGYHEDIRAKRLSKELGVPIDVQTIVQSHTPFVDLASFKDKSVLVVGGEYDHCKVVAEKYGFRNVITPSEIYAQYPSIWPFSKVFESYHIDSCRSRELPVAVDPKQPPRSLKIDAILVFNDPRDWGLDATIIIDCLLSKEGYIGTISEKNNNKSLSNNGFQQDGQPRLYFSNPDLWFASAFVLPRLGQGGFRWALEGLWTAITGGSSAGVELKKTIIGKPHEITYQFAEKRLVELRKAMFRGSVELPLTTIFMIGDNPESDIRGAMTYQSPFGCKWYSALVETGVYTGGQLSIKPSVVVRDVAEAVQWAIKTMNWQEHGCRS